MQRYAGRWSGWRASHPTTSLEQGAESGRRSPRNASVGFAIFQKSFENALPAFRQWSCEEIIRKRARSSSCLSLTDKLVQVCFERFLIGAQLRQLRIGDGRNKLGHCLIALPDLHPLPV